ncbi:Ig-like domain-containing protein [Actinoplanes sp. HUAS TT8]|uniref:Ig-like domain-containing protein n=1 Tax=Actinoplanes sp. HUAS TT8 TaxID=3447453 RepID=UPI003F52387E
MPYRRRIVLAMGDAALKTLRAAAIAALSSSLILTAGTPAFADDAPADTTAPVIDNIGLTDGQVYNQMSVFQPTVHDDTGVIMLETLVDGVRSRKFSVTRTGTRVGVDLTSVPDGTEVEIKLRAYDAAGNVAEKTVRVIADINVPHARISPASGTVMHSGPLTITVNDLPADIAKVALYDTGTGKNLDVRTEAPWTFDLTTVPGVKFVNLRLTDVRGNLGGASASYAIDDTPPVISDLAYSRESVVSGVPINVKVTTAGATIGPVGTLTATATDLTLRKTEWYVDGELKSTGSTLNWDDRASTRTSATIEIRATDALDQTTSKVFPVTIDRTGPVVTSLTPAQNALVRGSYFVTNSTVKVPSELVDAELVGLPSIANAPGGLAIYPKKDGPLTFTWWYVDKLGNQSFASRTVIVDNTRPALKLTKAPKNQAKLKGKVTVTATASDKNGVAKVQLLVNGKLVATDYRAGYAFSINTAKYGKTFKMQLRAYDRAGNYIYTTTRTYRRG